MEDKRTRTITIVLALLCCLALPLWGCGQQPQQQQQGQEQAQQDEAQADTAESADAAEADGTAEQAGVEYYDPNGDYKLKQVVVLSRHNIRAPLSTNGSALDLATPHTWIDWTANGSELTSRGGALETMAGQYVRKWLEHEELIPENYQPEDGVVRFYANSKQRTIATAQYFSSGMLPVANVDIETHVDYDTMDPVFTPQLTFVSDAYNEAALEQISHLKGSSGMAEVAAGLSDSFELIQDVVDYKESDGYKNGELTDLDTTDTGVVLELNKEPAMTGSLKTACQIADALVLQYYESTDAKAAAFGKDLTMDQWKLISKAKDMYGDVLFTAPLVATNVAHPLLAEIGNELDAQGRVFTFLCGHDSNIGSVLAALGVEDYELPGAIEYATPIGSKLLFERWEGADGATYGRVRLMYQSVDQLRSGSMLAGYEAPQSVELSFAGLQKNADGLYSYDELREHIARAASAYDDLVATYADQEQELAEAA
ncbi:MAG: histidine-type phosphatase [Atopobiaceae bacterium]|nr:histidine-type phosphatase [Atopobiaceae bacterium]